MDIMRIVLANTRRYLILSLIAGELVCCNHLTAADKPVAKAVVQSSYIIGPMDVLEIQVWKEPDFSRQVLVRPDGKITLPLVGDIHAAGMNTLDLKALLTEKLKGFIENPEVTVILVQSQSRKFYIIGNVSQPGTYPLSPDMTVLQALSAAGGLTQWADKDSIRIIRRSSEKEEIIPFDYDKVISGKKLEQNVLLRPNDTIIVP
jgi:polysaccharide export outer membrane protein